MSLAVQRTFSEELDPLVDGRRDQAVTAVLRTFLDNSGVARAEQVPLDRLEAFHPGGRGASYSWAVWASDDNLVSGPKFSVTGDTRTRADLAEALNLHVFEMDQRQSLDATVRSEVLARLLGVALLDIVAAVRGREIDVAAARPIEQLIAEYRFAWSS